MEDIAGKKFNYLTAIKPLYKYIPGRQWVWLCKCDCGKETNVLIGKLKAGSTKSCGCYKAKNLNHAKGPLSPQWAGYKTLSKSFYTRIKNQVELRNYDFNVSIEYLYDLYEKQGGRCAYTGEIINLPINTKQLRGENNEDIASLDRIDNDKHYIEGNLQWVCKRINYMKHTMTEDYFFGWVEKIYKHSILTNTIKLVSSSKK